MENNQIELSGVIVSDFAFEYEQYGEIFYSAKIECVRSSGTKDVIDLMIPDRTIYVDGSLCGKYVNVIGEVRTHNYKDDNGVAHLKVAVFVNTLDVFKECPNERIDINCVTLYGFLCKKSDVRRTPKGRTLLDGIVATHRMYSGNNYIPCIFWNKNAYYISGFDIGKEIIVRGRLQSRTYDKKINDNIVKRTAYEISVQEIEES